MHAGSRISPALAALAGIEGPGDLAAAQARMQELARLLGEQRSLAERRAGAANELDRAENQFQEAESSVEAKRRELEALLAEQGAGSVAELERWNEEFLAWQRAGEAVEAARRARDAALGERAKDPEEILALEAPDEAAWALELEQASNREREAAALVEACIERRSRIETKRAQLAESRSVAELELELGSVRTQIDAARRELAVLVLARRLLERTLKRFRDEHQPKILRRAGELLRVATRGIYTAVEPDEDGRTLLVEDATGGRRRAEALSTGTAELLYLVLRLGLVLDLSEGRGLLPVVLDDVLVNLDPERAAALARLLHEFTRTQQVVLLTCRPETRDLLLAQVEGALALELPRFAGRTGPVAGSDSEARSAGEAGRKLAATRLLEALGSSGEALGKKELLDRSGVLEAHWQGAIRDLEQGGLIEVLGDGRGRKYRPKA